MSSKREEKFAKPTVVCAFLPVDSPIKKTVEVDFAEKLTPMIREGQENAVKELFAALTSARQMVLWALDRDRTMVKCDELMSRLAEYGRLLRGFVAPPDTASEAKRAKTLRHVIGFVWRDLLDVKGRDWRASDVAIEEASMLLAAAQAILSRAAREAVSDANAIELHTNLRRVAGMLARTRSLVEEAEKAAALFAVVDDDDDNDDEKKLAEEKKKRGWFSSPNKKKQQEQEKRGDRIEDTVLASADLRLALPESWAQLGLAEAQHATIRRACSQSHIDWSLIASLCADQRERYATNIAGHVMALTKAAPEASNVREWAGKRIALTFLKSHVDMKALYFEALYLYCQGASALERAVADTDENACTSAIAHLSAAAKKHKEAQAAAERFVSTAKPITYVDSPVLALAESFDLIRRALDRANQLNNSIFHKPPTTQLEPSPEKKSLISAVPYEVQEPSPLWTQQAWDAFDPDKLPDAPDFGFASASRDCCVIS